MRTVVAIALSVLAVSGIANARGLHGKSRAVGQDGHTTSTHLNARGRVLARCKDGAYTYTASRRDACLGHWGVASWL